MEITDNIYSLAQQIFQLIQQQSMEITINQQTIQYQDTRKIFKYKSQRKTENTIDKMVLKIKLAIEEPTSVTIYQELTKETLEILLNPEIDFITVNQMRKIINTQFEELQNKITQVILEKEVQEILKDRKLELENVGDLDGAQY
ncbi:hypothetical protein G9A89_005835 [Geosiphon pyriformis]|nr:hypothetical protein G9A89_005835 [Geosiphon pyriformis]